MPRTVEDVEGEYTNEKLLIQIIQLCLQKERITNEAVTRNKEKFIDFDKISAGDGSDTCCIM